MAEYIDREAVINLITMRYENPEICTAEINNIPVADVAPVVHGKWEKSQDFIVAIKCGACGEDILLDYSEQYEEWSFCPYCGARMDGTEETDEVQK